MVQIAEHITGPGGAEFSVENPAPSDRNAAMTGVTSDSRRVAPGFMFCAIPGSQTDGRRFIGEAVARGATTVIAPNGTDWPALKPDVLRLEAGEPRRVLALAAAAFYDRQPRHMAAVTGTSGKTSTALFTQQLLAALGHHSASLGTLGLIADGFPATDALTTPAPEDLHRLLAEIADAGIDHCAIEASSHGLDQHRLDGVRIWAAGFTNLGRDHLDYHPDKAAYFAAKARLFRDLLQPDGVAVINADAPEADDLLAIASQRGIRAVTYGRAGRDLKLLDAVPQSTSILMSVGLGRHRQSITVPLVGAFQAHNVLCAMGLALALDGGLDSADRQSLALIACAGLKGAPGRMDHVATHASGAPIFVDYAHKPDALDTVLRALRPHTANRLVCVFGCGGDRDRGKRPEMGRIAANLADRVIVTDDNPRTENPDAIRAEIMAACPTATEIGDRREAIKTAIAELTAGDVLVIAGKGHETGQKIGSTILPFSDTETAQELVGETKQ